MELFEKYVCTSEFDVLVNYFTALIIFVNNIGL